MNVGMICSGPNNQCGDDNIRGNLSWRLQRGVELKIMNSLCYLNPQSVHVERPPLTLAAGRVGWRPCYK